MSAKLITGNLFKPIYAYQDADYQAGISGNVTSIMPVGSQMALSIEDANTIKADNGVLITKEGRRIQIDAGAIEEWSIPTGTQGQTNYFIIGFHLYTDSNSAEVCETFVEQMENATDTISENTFRSGATEVYISLGRVVQNGINLESVTSLVQIAQSFEDVKNAITQLNSDLSVCGKTKNAIYNNTNIDDSGSTTTFTANNDMFIAGQITIRSDGTNYFGALLKINNVELFRADTRGDKVQTMPFSPIFIKAGTEVSIIRIHSTGYTSGTSTIVLASWS